VDHVQYLKISFNLSLSNKGRPETKCHLWVLVRSLVFDMAHCEDRRELVSTPATKARTLEACSWGPAGEASMKHRNHGTGRAQDITVHSSEEIVKSGPVVEVMLTARPE
jgi:hypothetical protein